MTVHVKFSETLPLRAAEWIMSFTMITWGLIVLTNPGIFSTAPSFRGMEHIMPQNTWGILALLFGTIGSCALAINGFWVATPFIRAVCAFIRCFFWFQITLGLFAGGVATTGLAIYPWLFAMDMWNIYRAMSDARRAVV